MKTRRFQISNVFVSKGFHKLRLSGLFALVLWSVSMFFSCKKPQHTSGKENQGTEKSENLTEIYTLIDSEGEVFGKINSSDIARLDESLRALAAYYSAGYGSNCFDNSCELTQALGLGLGKQGSEAHKALIEKWFPRGISLGRNENGLYTLNSGASHFEDYKTLTFKKKGDTVDVSFILMSFFRGKTVETEWHDRYKISSREIILLKQQKQLKKIADGKIDTH